MSLWPNKDTRITELQSRVNYNNIMITALEKHNKELKLALLISEEKVKQLTATVKSLQDSLAELTLT